MSIISASHGKRILDAARKRGEADALEATVRDEINIGQEIIEAQTDGVYRQAVLDNSFFRG